jgi:endonuclease YncB( thermonuclease family)
MFVALVLSLPVAIGDAQAETLSGPYPAAVEEVIDGDTLRVRVTVWFGQELVVGVRLRGVDAPERRGACESERRRAAAATAALARLVGGGAVTLTDIEGDKYFGRVVADVRAGRIDVAEALVRSGHARAYDGGARGGWCEIGALDAAPALASAE